jgi:hypothetical protein
MPCSSSELASSKCSSTATVPASGQSPRAPSYLSGPSRFTLPSPSCRKLKALTLGYGALSSDALIVPIDTLGDAASRPLTSAQGAAGLFASLPSSLRSLSLLQMAINAVPNFRPLGAQFAHSAQTAVADAESEHLKYACALAQLNARLVDLVQRRSSEAHRIALVRLVVDPALPDRGEDGLGDEEAAAYHSVVQRALRCAGVGWHGDAPFSQLLDHLCEARALSLSVHAAPLAAEPRSSVGSVDSGGEADEVETGSEGEGASAPSHCAARIYAQSLALPHAGEALSFALLPGLLHLALPGVRCFALHLCATLGHVPALTHLDLSDAAIPRHQVARQRLLRGLLGLTRLQALNLGGVFQYLEGAARLTALKSLTQLDLSAGSRAVNPAGVPREPARTVEILLGALPQLRRLVLRGRRLCVVGRAGNMGRQRVVLRLARLQTTQRGDLATAELCLSTRTKVTKPLWVLVSMRRQERATAAAMGRGCAARGDAVRLGTARERWWWRFLCIGAIARHT